MNVLVDAQPPRRLRSWLATAGCNAIHTLDLPGANRTTDEQINDPADIDAALAYAAWRLEEREEPLTVP
jgi:predicted nuclease of predicted toxin-antitoxin system